MTTIPGDLKYSDDHEWISVEGGLARIGITEYAQEQLGDIVYVELPAVGTKVAATKAFGVVESVKAANDIFSPVSGTVSETNPRLMDEPELVNADPYGEGWMVAITLSDAAELDGLMDAEAYSRFVAEQEG